MQSLPDGPILSAEVPSILRPAPHSPGEVAYA